MFVNDHSVKFKEKLLANAKSAGENGAPSLQAVGVLLSSWIDRSVKFMLEGSGLSVCSSETPEAGIDSPASLPSLLLNPYPICFIQWNRLKKHRDVELTGILIITVDEQILAECQAHNFVTFGSRKIDGVREKSLTFPATALGAILTIAITGHGDYIIPMMGYYFHPSDVQAVKMKINRGIRKILEEESRSGRTINQSIAKLLKDPRLNETDEQPEPITRGRGNGIKDNGHFVLFTAEYFPEMLATYGQGDTMMGLQQSAYTAQAMALFSMDFMAIVNCANVVIETTSPPDKLNAKRARNGRPLFSEFKTLVINDSPAAEYNGDDVPKAEPTGIHQRQHIRRAHIRVLRDGRNVYVRACVAGRAELGTIRKNYLVQ